MTTLYSVGLLTLLTVLSGWLLPSLLIRSRWLWSKPDLGLAALHATAAAYLIGLAALAMRLSHDVLEHALVWALHADKSQLHSAYAGGDMIDGAWNLAALGIVALFLLLGGVLVRALRRATRAREAHLLLLPSLPTNDGTIAIVPDRRPGLWCMPGRRSRSRVLITTGALSLLSEEELAAAVAHEQGHVRRRHHMMILVAESVTWCVGRWGALNGYAETVRRLVELDADDAAARYAGRRTVASALLVLGDRGDTVGSALAMSSSHTGARIERLIAPPPTRRRSDRPALIVGAAALLLVPLAVLFVPGLALIGTAH